MSHVPVDRRFFIVLLVGVLAAGMALRVHKINGSLPYPLHIDERNVSRPAIRILQTGDLNPHFFQKPSLPIYLAAAAYAFGFLDAAGHLGLRSVDQIGSVEYPFYTHRRVVRPARILFAAFSIVSLALSGVIAMQITGSAAQLFVAPLVLSASAWFLGPSWMYLNADVIGTTFVLGAVVASFAAMRGRAGMFDSAVAPGMLCGFATASKYHFAVVLLSCLACLWLSDAPRKGLRSLVLGAAAAAAYLITVPYALLDLRAFLNEVAYQVAAYGMSREPWRQAVRGAEYAVRDFGQLSLLAAGVGLIAIGRRDFRPLVGLVLFFVSLSVVLSQYRLYFARNVLPLFAIYAIIASAGIGGAAVAIASRSARRVREGVALAALLAVFAASLPWSRVLEAYAIQIDSRILVVRWIRENLPAGSRIVIPEELAMNAGALEREYDVMRVRFADLEPGDEPSWVLVPAFAVRRGPTAPAARALRAKAERIGGMPVVTFEGGDVLVGYWVPVPWGNPKIQVRRFGRGPGEL